MTLLRRRLLAAVAIGVAVAGLGIAGLVTDRFGGVQNQWEDLLQPGLAAADDVVVVAIDRETLGTTGGWPWARDLHASLLNRIAEAEPGVVIYDVLFADPREGDDALAAAIGSTPTILGAALTLDVSAGGPARIIDAVVPLEQLAARAVDVGHLNVTYTTDRGVVRSLPLYVLDGRGVAQPSVVLSAVAYMEGASGPLIERPDGVQIGDRFVPLDGGGELHINWSDALGDDDVIPAIEVLRGEIDPERFAGKVVLVGVTEPTLGDQHLVPVDRAGNTSGVVVLANAANTVLSSGYLYPAPDLREVLVVAALGLAITAFYVFTPLRVAMPVSIAAIAAIVLIASWRFHATGTSRNIVWPVLTVVFAAAAGTAWRYVTETRHRRAAWRMFSTYVPASVVGQLEDPRLLAKVAEGSRHEVTVLFCDLRGFTPVAAVLEPPQVRELLDRYYDYAVDAIHRHGGTVMQFVGDEVFAVFGAPIASGTAAEQAARCALSLQHEVGRLDERLASGDLPPIRFGIGLHRGTVVAAHVGTADRRQYSVIGDTVNVGSRLCSQAAAGEVVASDAVWSVLPDRVAAGFPSAERVNLKGVTAAVTVHRASEPSGGADAVTDASASGDRERGGFRHAWESRRWRLLLGTVTVSGVGDWLYATAFAVWLYQRTGSAAWLGAAVTARMLVYILLGPLGGAMAARWPRRPLMIGLDVARAGTMLALAALMAADGPPLAGTVIVVVASALTVPYRPALAAATPHVVPESALAAANGAEAVVGQISVFVGPALAGIILAVGSASVAIVVNAITFVVAALLLVGCGDLGGGWRMEGGDDRSASDEQAAPGVLAGIAVGWRVLVTVPGLFVLNAFVVVSVVAFGAETVLHVLVAEEQLGRGAEFVGALMAALGIGGLLIAPLTGRIAASPRPGVWLIACGVASGLPLMLLGVITSPALALGVLAIEGMGVIVFEVLAITLLQRLAGEHIAEVFGIQDSSSSAGQLLGAIGAPILVAVGGLTLACVVGGGVLVAFSILAAPALLRCGRLAETEGERIAPIADELAALGLFDGADRASVELVAAAAVAESVEAGAVVIAEGTEPDDLFVIRTGTFSAATAAHGTLRLMTAGDWFGEIGLIERRLRTASVVAESDAEVWRIPGDVFLHAAAGSGTIPDPLRRGIAARLTLSSLPVRSAA